MENTNQKPLPFNFLPYIGLVALVALLLVSIISRDLRYIGIGIILFGLMYFGCFSLWFFLRKPVFFAVIYASLALFIMGGGLALFLHHYDIDQLFNLYKEFAKFIAEKL